MINPIERAFKLRETLYKNGNILVVDFSNTLQGIDSSKILDLMPTTTGEFVFRTKVNIKEIDPIAAERKDIKFFDLKNKNDSEIEEFLKRHDFDFPLWFKHNEGFSMRRALDYNAPFIFQVAGCNFHDGSSTGGCWYCFVDDKSNDGKPANGKCYLGVDQTIASMIIARGKIRQAYQKYGTDVSIKVLRASGGEPTIVLDQILALWKTVERKGLDFVGQLDSNLSTGILVDAFEKKGIYENNILKKLAQYPIKILTAIKGVDIENLQSNVQSTANLEEQLYSITRFLRAGFDIYPQMYNPNPKTLGSYLHKMDNEIENFSLRVHVGPLKVYGPNSCRLVFEAKRLGIDPDEFIKMKKQEWDTNFEQSCEVLDDYLKKTYGVGYKDVVRSDVKLNIIK